MLHVRSVDEIADFLLRLQQLVLLQESGSADFAANVDDWLSSLEQVFEANRLYQAGNIAMLRSRMVAAKQGQVPAGIELQGRQSRSRLLRAVASGAMQHGAEIASDVVAENRARIEEATGVAQQIIAAAVSRDLVPPREVRVDNSVYLRLLRRGLADTADLESAVVHIEGLVGPQDTLVLLDRALASHVHLRQLADGAATVDVAR